MSTNVDDAAELWGLLAGEDREAFKEIYRALDGINQGETTDKGFAGGEMDAWITIDGKEYYITVKLSNNQIKKQQH